MGGLGALITIIIIVAWVVKGLSSAVGNEDSAEKKRKRRSLEEWDQVQAQRREEMSEQQRALSEMRSDASAAPDPAQMTMAERIELARQRARQQSGGAQQEDAQAEALRRARARADQQTQQKRQAAQQQQRAEQERAARKKAARERERDQQHRRRVAEQKAREEQLERQRRRRTRGTRPKQRAPKATTGSKRESVVAQSQQRVHKGHEHAQKKAAKRAPAVSAASNASAVLGSLDRASLRKAFIMKELLDKPVALRDPQADLPS